MLNYTDKNTIARIIVSAITSINMIILAFGGEAIAISDSTLYLVSSIIAFVITVGYAIYKNNPTSTFGMLCKRIKGYVKEYGIDEVYRVIIEALKENFNDEDDDPEDDEVLPQ